MVGDDQGRQTLPQLVLRAMGELQARDGMPPPAVEAQDLLEGEPSQGDDHLDTRNKPDFTFQVGYTIGDLGSRGPVLRGRATAHRRDKEVV